MKDSLTSTWITHLWDRVDKTSHTMNTWGCRHSVICLWIFSFFICGTFLYLLLQSGLLPDPYLYSQILCAGPDPPFRDFWLGRIYWALKALTSLWHLCQLRPYICFTPVTFLDFCWWAVTVSQTVFLFSPLGWFFFSGTPRQLLCTCKWSKSWTGIRLD